MKGIGVGVPSAGQPNEEERQDEIEVLLHRQGPGDIREPFEIILDEEELDGDSLERKGSAVPGIGEVEEGDEEPEEGVDLKAASKVEAPDLDASGPALLLEEQTADEEPAQNKKEIDPDPTAEPESGDHGGDGGGRVGGRQQVPEHDQQDGEGAQEI
jgi:hypothetical protein